MTVQIETEDISGLLWIDDSVLRWKHEKTVGVLMALRKLFENAAQRTDRELEFLQQLHWCEQAEEEFFERVFCHPRAYHWARVAFDLVAAVHRGAEISNGTAEYLQGLQIADLDVALAYHLKQFNLFVAALALHCRESVAFTPTPLNTPAVLPGTEWSISNPSSQVQLCGVQADGTLGLFVDGDEVSCPTHDRAKSTTHETTLHLAPQVVCGEGVITLQPHAFNVPGLKDIRSVASAAVEDQYPVVAVLERTLRLIRTFGPETYRQIGRYLRVIAFKPSGAGGVFNTSCSRLPGASIFTASGNAMMLADDLIHEFYHNRLFALEERFAFLSGDSDQVRPTTFYSPWREDPRPIYGLFHAAFVFERVHGFWISAIDSGQLTEMDLAYAKSRVAMLGSQLQITLAQLLCWGNFTAEGRAICEAVSGALRRDLVVAKSLGIDGETPLVHFDPQAGFRYSVGDAGRPIRAKDDLTSHICEYDVNQRTEQVVNDHFEQVVDFASAIADLV